MKNLTLLVAELTNKVKWLFYLRYHGSFASDLFQSGVTNADTAIVIYFGLTLVNASCIGVAPELSEVFFT